MSKSVWPRTWVPVLGLAAGLLGIASPAAAQTVTVGDVSVPENGGPAVFHVTGSVPAGNAGGSVTFGTADGTATVSGQSVTGGYDFVNLFTGVTLPNNAGGNAPLPFDIPVNVTINGDNVFEPNETFTATLTGPPAGISVVGGPATGTITNDDSRPTISISDVIPTIEGNTGSSLRGFAVTLSNPTFESVSVDYATISQTASAAAANADYQATNGTITFPPFDTSDGITVVVNGDTLFELDETFLVQLSNPSATAAGITDSQAVHTILNDDALPSFSINDVTECEEDGAITFTVTLSAPSGVDTTVDFYTSGLTAASDEDFPSTTGTLTFPKGEVTRTVTIPIVDDGTLEENETFTVSLSNIQPTSSANILDGVGVGTILDNDGVNTLILENIGTEGTVISGTGGPVQRFRATATNGCGDPVAGVTLQFNVYGNTGSDRTVNVVTDADGQAIFEYVPLFPGFDTVEVTTDPFNFISGFEFVNVEITVAPNTVNGQAAGNGNVGVLPDTSLNGFFTLDVNTNRAGKAKGSFQASIPGFVGNVRSKKVLALLISTPETGGRAAVIFGTGKIAGFGVVRIRIDVLDNGTGVPGVPNDRFFLTFLPDTGKGGEGAAETAGGTLKFLKKGLLNDIRVRTP